jgi:hypothetical protein
MVKEQNLALNPAKISGICGRLMCCMAYEHLTYNELWRSLPSPGSKIRTTQGNFILEGVDLRSKTVRVHFTDGKEIPIAIAEFANFKETVLNGDSWDRGVPEEPARRLPLSPGRSRPLSAKPASPADVHENSARNNRRPKPEKISIEEHLAERLQPESRVEHKIERQAARQFERQPVSGAPAENESREGPVEKRGRRHRGKAPSGAVPVERQPAAASEGGAETLPSPRREPPHEERAAQAEGPAGGERHGGHARRRPRRRPSGGETPAGPEIRKENT